MQGGTELIAEKGILPLSLVKVDKSLFAKALNNACISYNDIIWSIYISI